MKDENVTGPGVNVTPQPPLTTPPAEPAPNFAPLIAATRDVESVAPDTFNAACRRLADADSRAQAALGELRSTLPANADPAPANVYLVALRGGGTVEVADEATPAAVLQAWMLARGIQGGLLVFRGQGIEGLGGGAFIAAEVIGVSNAMDNDGDEDGDAPASDQPLFR